MNASMPSSVQPAHAAQNPLIWLGLSLVLTWVAGAAVNAMATGRESMAERYLRASCRPTGRGDRRSADAPPTVAAAFLDGPPVAPPELLAASSSLGVRLWRARWRGAAARGDTLARLDLAGLSGSRRPNGSGPRSAFPLPRGSEYRPSGVP